MVSIEFNYDDHLRCSALHCPSDSRLDTDAPVDNKGLGQAFSPTDLVATALGTCMLTTVAIKAEDKSWDLSGLSGRVEKHMSQTTPRRIVAMKVAIQWPEALTDDACQFLERVALACPVAKSIHPDIELTTKFSRPIGTG